MHIAFISMRYPRNESEWVRVYERKLVKYLRDLVDVSIYSWALHYKEQPYDIDGMRINIIPAINYTNIQKLYDKKAGFAAAVLDTVNDLLKVLGTTTAVHKLHSRKKIDVILAASFSVSAFYPALIAKLKNIPLLTQSFGFDVSVVPSIGYGQRSKLNKQRLLSTYALKAADAITPNSKGLASDTVLAEYMDKVKVVYHGVDTEEYDRSAFTQIKSRPSKRKKLTVLNVGGLRKVKGWKHIVKTAEKLKKYQIDFKIVGGDDDLKEFEKMVTELKLKNIEYGGQISHGELKKYYYDTDIFFLPSLSEGLPNSMLEAASMELALLGSGKGGTRDIIINNKNGYYIKDPDPDLFAKKILYLYKNPDLLKKMKKHARKTMKDKFQWESNVRKLVEIFEKLKKR